MDETPINNGSKRNSSIICARIIVSLWNRLIYDVYIFVFLDDYAPN